MKKTFVVAFLYDNGISMSEESAIVFAKGKEEAESVFRNNIRRIFSYNEDTCTITFIREVSDDVSLLYIKNGNCWAE